MNKTLNRQVDNYSFDIEANSLKSVDAAPKKYRNDIPEGALYFKAVASNGDLNRNGYIIRSKAWKADGGKYLKDYLINGKILYQHNSEKPIGKPLNISVVNDELILEGWVYDDIYTDGLIGRGLVTSISTGHITLEREWENSKTGETKTDEEFFADESWWENWISGLWVMAVTAAEIVENSFVTIPSNRVSHLINNKQLLVNKLGISEDEINTLFNKTGFMKKNDKLVEELKNLKIPATNTVDEVEDGQVEEGQEVDTDETDAVDTPETDTEDTNEDGKGNEGTETQENKVILDANAVKEIFTNGFNQINKMIDSKFAEIDKKINKFKAEQRNGLANVVKNENEDDDNNTQTTNVKDVVKDAFNSVR